jgi:glycosyltransferase involved in cell wall biosynthesis
MILFVAKYSRSVASARQRAFNWSRRLRSKGHKTVTIFRYQDYRFRRKWFHRIRFGIEFSFFSMWAGTIVFQKYIPFSQLYFFLKGKKIIVDFDDRIYNDKDCYDEKSLFRRLLTFANTVIVSVPAMKNELEELLPGVKSKLVVIPTLIDLNRTEEEKRNWNFKETMRPRKSIGWIGSCGGLPNLELIEESLFKLFQDFDENLDIFIVSDQPYIPKNRHLKVKNIRWSLENEYRYFAWMDVTIMPLADTQRNRCKAGFKIIQSLAMGVPVVASAIGFNNEIIQHGRNGFLAKSADDFYTYIRMLLIDDRLRNSMASEACRSVKKFDYAQWIDIYKNACLSNDLRKRIET